MTSHVAQVVEDGYEFFAQRGLVTIFSAPNYSKNWCCNSGVVMNVSPELVCSFVVFKARAGDAATWHAHDHRHDTTHPTRSG